MTDELPDLTPEEEDRYAWQFDVRDFGREGQRRLKGATVLISRVGGVGGAVALQLAAAGIGRLILAHGGNLRRNDLNRQTLMTTDWIDRPRVESARDRLLALNPNVQIDMVDQNISETNAAELVSRCDIVVSSAPLFSERLLMNQEAVRQRKPLVDSAMYELEGQLTTVIPGETACLECLYPEAPPMWKRQFPVFSAVSATVGALAAMEVIKVITGVGESLAGRLLLFDLREMRFRTLPIERRQDCVQCRALCGTDHSRGTTAGTSDDL
ncbi:MULTISPECIES: ThiF family adenylyltransferase [unclassified Schlesneria]|uniref:HesA/MoeB/ThiF family protein n=1 Tax=Schlesneria TaxID=656899 RepID=UPI00359F2ED0